MLLSPNQLADAEHVVDFDSSVVTIETLDAFGSYVMAGAPNAAEIQAELEALTAQGMNGELPFEDSLTARLKLFDAHYYDVAAFSEQVVDHISPSALANREWFESNAERIHIVSGGFEEFILPVAAKLGLLATNIHGNRFIFDRSGHVVGHDTDRLPAHTGGKAAQVLSLGLEGPVIASGDGCTDLEIRDRGAADEVWAITETVARPRVVAAADRVVANFTELIAQENAAVV
jgi:D-3-phosphoglycerate dehydrogenase